MLLFQLVISVLLVGLGSEQTDVSASEVEWATDGLTRDALIARISNATGKPGAVPAAGNQRTGGGTAGGPSGNVRRLYCTNRSVPLKTASALLQLVFGVVAWEADGTSIWLDENRAPALVLADVRIARLGDHRSDPGVAVEMPRGDVDLAGVSTQEAVVGIALAFDVAIVYSGECVQPDGRVSLALEDVDLDTCLSLMVEQLGLQWSRIGSLIYFEPSAMNEAEKNSAGAAATSPGDSAKSDRQLDLAEAGRLCVEADDRR